MTGYRDEEDVWKDDDESPVDDSGDDSGDESTVPCPACGRAIFEDSPRCPYCEQYISEEDRARPRHPAWVITTALVCLAAAFWWVIVRLF
jgi:predicted nucleic acid-binding Zn ribbon protein